jgi:cell division septation protein DedD
MGNGMAEQRDSGFELVLSNRQLLSLFFVVVVFFAGFFSVGYFVGYGHAQGTSVAPEFVEAPPPAPVREEVPVPSAVEEPAVVAQTPAPAPVVEKAAPRPARPTRQSAPPPAVIPPTKTPTTVAPAPRTVPAPRPASATTNTNAYNVQVSAVRVADDAAILSNRLRERGYPTHVAAGTGDGWHRIMIGPFASKEAAQESQLRLKADGFDTVLKAP